jgi:hypothetical protein
MKNRNLLLTVAVFLGMTFGLTAQNVPSYVPTNGLVGYWPFCGNAHDESGNGNNGTVNGASLTTDRFGNAGSAYDFDGNADFILVQNSSSLVPNSITISGWVLPRVNNVGIIDKVDSLTPANYGYSIIHSYQGNNGLFTGWNTNGSCTYPLQNEGNTFGPIGSISNLVWSNFVVTIDSQGVCKQFINGQLTHTYSHIPLNPCLSNNSKLFFGRQWGGDPLWLNGSLDDIAIWNRALTQQEITDLYNATNCANNTAITPQTNTLITGSTAIFNATTSDPNPSYLWQSDFGQGFQTLNDFGNYTGTNTGLLNIANVQLPNHTQSIRVITTSGNCIDTSNVAIISIADTCINTATDTILITVTDTLIINSTITGLNPPNNANTIKVFPNPTNDHITIDYGNISLMNGYQLRIENSLGQQVFQTNITQQSDYLNLTTWGGNGLYFVRIIDPQGNTIDIRKIVLQ